ncbi:MAG: glycosyltransferase family 2 protein [Gracilimonas sp.]
MMNGNALFATFRSMEIILCISTLYIAYTLLVLGRNWFEFKSLSEQDSYSGKKAPLVSICIPARNEEAVIERCVTSVLKQSYPNFEVLVLNDNSTDRTTEILNNLSGIITNLHHLIGKPKPDDWHGKPWACQQLSTHAAGKYLVFIDADVWLEEDAITKAVQALKTSDTITVWPKQIVAGFFEKLTIPMIYFGLYTLLPAKYVERNPRWLPKHLSPKIAPKFAAACGQFIAFNRKAYDEIGGHASVKQEIVEDVELSKLIKQNGLTITMYDGVGTVNCRMYRSHSDIFSGLRKNFFTGFGKNVPLFLAMGILQFVVYIMPFVLLFAVESIIQIWAVVLVSTIFLQRWLLDFRFGWNSIISLLHPFTILWYEILAIRCLWDHFTGAKASWKGRDV